MANTPKALPAALNSIAANDYASQNRFNGIGTITSVGGKADADINVVTATSQIALDISNRYNASLGLMIEKAGKYSADFERFAYAAYDRMNGELPSAPSFSSKPLPTGKEV